jgi:hypothetical protein
VREQLQIVSRPLLIEPYWGLFSGGIFYDLLRGISSVCNLCHQLVESKTIRVLLDHPWQELLQDILAAVGLKFPMVSAMWRRQWQQVIPFFA